MALADDIDATSVDIARTSLEQCTAFRPRNEGEAQLRAQNVAQLKAYLERAAK